MGWKGFSVFFLLATLYVVTLHAATLEVRSPYQTVQDSSEDVADESDVLKDQASDEGIQRLFDEDEDSLDPNSENDIDLDEIEQFEFSDDPNEDEELNNALEVLPMDRSRLESELHTLSANKRTPLLGAAARFALKCLARQFGRRFLKGKFVRRILKSRFVRRIARSRLVRRITRGVRRFGRRIKRFGRRLVRRFGRRVKRFGRRVVRRVFCRRRRRSSGRRRRSRRG